MSTAGLAAAALLVPTEIHDGYFGIGDLGSNAMIPPVQVQGA